MEPQAGEAARVAVIYYSATGNVHGLARAVAEGAEGAGAEVRLRHVEELASELVIFAEPVLGTASLPKSPTPPLPLSTTSTGQTGSRSGPRPVSATSPRS